MQRELQAPATQPDAYGQLVTPRDLSRLSGVGVGMVHRLTKSRMIPQPVGGDEKNPLYDLSDPALANWVRRLQAAGYNRGQC